MQEFVEYVVKGLVDQPDAVTVTEVEGEGTTVYELRMDSEDVAKVIGRRGVTINAIRSLLRPAPPRRACAVGWRSSRTKTNFTRRKRVTCHEGRCAHAVSRDVCGADG